MPADNTCAPPLGAVATSRCYATGDALGHACECLPGFEGTGFACADIKECQTAPPSVHAHQCDDHAVCEDRSPGSYQCTCIPPKVGDGFLCYVAASPPPSAPPPALPPPALPWAETLRADPTKRTWALAKLNCELHGGALAEPRSELMNAAVREAARTSALVKEDLVWLGGQSGNGTAVWSWASDGGTFSNGAVAAAGAFTRWAAGEPAAATPGAVDCLSLNVVTAAGLAPVWLASASLTLTYTPTPTPTPTPSPTPSPKPLTPDP